MSQQGHHDYKGHTIRVDVVPDGSLRPWGVWVEGELLYTEPSSANGINRRRAFLTTAGALNAGKRHVRVLLEQRRKAAAELGGFVGVPLTRPRP